jgi:hypothetical protein
LGSPLLSEGTVTLIAAQLQANYKAALVAVSTARADNRTSLEEPRSYFLFDTAKQYQCPAVFIDCPEFDHAPESGQNYIKAIARVTIAVVCEEQTQELLTYKLWRHTSALFNMLNLADLVAGNLKCHVIVKRQAFSDQYMRKSETEESDNVFRKEVLFELEVVHQENF